VGIVGPILDPHTSVRTRTGPVLGGVDSVLTCMYAATGGRWWTVRPAWGSRGRRFKSCHPDGVVAGQSLTGDESGEALMVFGQILDPRSSRGLCVGRWRTRAIGGGA